MSKFTKKLDSNNIEIAVNLVFGIYGKYFCSNSKQLAELISEEFDADVTVSEIEDYFSVPTNEEEDIRCIYSNIFS